MTTGARKLVHIALYVTATIAMLLAAWAVALMQQRCGHASAPLSCSTQQLVRWANGEAGRVLVYVAMVAVTAWGWGRKAKISAREPAMKPASDVGSIDTPAENASSAVDVVAGNPAASASAHP